MNGNDSTSAFFQFHYASGFFTHRIFSDFISFISPFFLSLYDLSRHLHSQVGRVFIFCSLRIRFPHFSSLKALRKSQSFLQKVFHCTYFGVRGERDSFIMWRKMGTGFFFPSPAPLFPLLPWHIPDFSVPQLKSVLKSPRGKCTGLFR